MTFQSVVEVGTQQLPFGSANKARLINIIALITAITSGLYTLSYVFVFQHFGVAFINLLFTIAYVLTLKFNYHQHHRGSKIWFFCVLMLHLVICTNVYVTKESGFHLYFYLVPTGSYLLFELDQRFEKIWLSLLAVALFFFCENRINPTPMIELSEQMNHYLFQSVMLVNMLEVILVLSIFSHEIASNEKQLQQQAETDSLTGIANRHTFFSEGKLLLHKVDYHRPLSLVILDLDYFKSINDEHGHVAGDLVLTEVCNLISRHCCPTDVFARIGGEEFALLMPDTSLEMARVRSESIRAAIAAHSIPIFNKPNFRCTASLGVSTTQSSKDSLRDLLILSDKALYRAKEQGRNRVESCLKTA